jgi:hypothetical protein
MKPRMVAAPNVGAFLCVARIDARPFNSDEHKSRDQHGRSDLLDQTSFRQALATPEVRTKEIGLERSDQDHDEDKSGNDLCDGDDGVDGGGALDPAKIMKWKAKALLRTQARLGWYFRPRK